MADEAAQDIQALNLRDDSERREEVSQPAPPPHSFSSPRVVCLPPPRVNEEIGFPGESTREAPPCRPAARMCLD